MLNHVIKLFIFILLLLIFSCKQKNIGEINLLESNNIIGTAEYKKVKKQIYDSIGYWNQNNIEQYSNDGLYKLNWKIDTLLCFNNSKTKFVTALEKQFKDDGFREGIDFFYGAKINNKWYFFTGAYIVLPREMYQSDLHTPLSFEKLHEIALKEVFSGYLKKKEPIVPWYMFWMQQEYEVDESYFDKHFKGSGWGCIKWVDKNHDGMSSPDESIDTCSEDDYNVKYKKNGLANWQPKMKEIFDEKNRTFLEITEDSFNVLYNKKIINKNGFRIQ